MFDNEASNRDNDAALDRADFEDWMDAVDLAVEALCGLSTLDLADQPYRAWYEDGLDADEAADLVLEAEGFPF